MSLHHRLLDDTLIRYRDIEGKRHDVTLPQLFVALADDSVRDFPALRPHQRHPWHAFLVQLAAIALHASKRSASWETAGEWRDALLALTPGDPDGAAYALVAPDDRPAFMQPPCERGESHAWKKRLATPDAIDMLITSRNHDVKAARMMRANAEDWIYALVSLQTQEGFLGAGNYGISRMNGGFASRPALGIVPVGHWGRRWTRDVQQLLANRARVVREQGLKAKGGIALVWLHQWDGTSSLSFDALDPFYIEICRRIRLVQQEDGSLSASGTSSKAVRIAAKERNGVTGDAWTPVVTVDMKALSITARGFDYKLMSALAFSNKFTPPIAREFRHDDVGDKRGGDSQSGDDAKTESKATPNRENVYLLAQGITRGQGKTEGYHERRIRVSPKMRALFRKWTADEHAMDGVAKVSEERIEAIAIVRRVLWGALCALFDNGKESATDDIKNKANEFAKPFEQEQDRRFFDDLIDEIEADDPQHTRDAWLLDIVDRAAGVLKRAFIAGPQATARRYRAQSAAIGRFHGGLRSDKPELARIKRVLRDRDEARSRARQETLEKV